MKYGRFCEERDIPAGIEADGFVVSVDTSAGQDADEDDFEVVADGVISVSADFTPRMVMRHYVEGDRAVILSDMGKIVIEMIYMNDSAIQRFILEAAEKGDIIRYIYSDTGERTYSGEATVYIKSMGEDRFGMKITVVMEGR